MKAERKIFKGIEFVLFDELPQAQQDKFAQTLSQDLFIKIMMDGKVVSKCIQYHDYSNWFEKVYKAPANVTVVQKAAADKIPVTTNLALSEI
jgi:hypothetical protein